MLKYSINYNKYRSAIRDMLAKLRILHLKIDYFITITSTNVIVGIRAYKKVIILLLVKYSMQKGKSTQRNKNNRLELIKLMCIGWRNLIVLREWIELSVNLWGINLELRI